MLINTLFPARGNTKPVLPEARCPPRPCHLGVPRTPRSGLLWTLDSLREAFSSVISSPDSGLYSQGTRGRVACPPQAGEGSAPSVNGGGVKRQEVPASAKAKLVSRQMGLRPDRPGAGGRGKEDLSLPHPGARPWRPAPGDGSRSGRGGGGAARLGLPSSVGSEHTWRGGRGGAGAGLLLRSARLSSAAPSEEGVAGTGP